MTTAPIAIDRILCPVDFSPLSGPGVERAIRLGDWFGAGVEVLHVMPSVSLAMAGDPAAAICGGPLEAAAAERERSARSLDELVAPFRDEGVPIQTRVLEGEPLRVILDEAAALPADLLVIGTHGRSGLERLLLGSVTENVLRQAPCPVLTVAPSCPPPRTGPLFRRILCAADLTHASGRTLEMALALAIENGARITLLHVIDTPPGDTWAGLRVAVPEVEPSRHEFVARARAELRKAVPDASRNLCEVTERVETGAPWSEILVVANQMDADLIVMGARPRGPVGRILSGPTASRVARRAACPVLVVHDARKRTTAALNAVPTNG